MNRRVAYVRKRSGGREPAWHGCASLSLPVWLFWLIVLSAALPLSGRADEVEEVLRERVEAMRGVASVAAAGQPIAARLVLPELYASNVRGAFERCREDLNFRPSRYGIVLKAELGTSNQEGEPKELSRELVAWGFLGMKGGRPSGVRSQGALWCPTNRILGVGGGNGNDA